MTRILRPRDEGGSTTPPDVSKLEFGYRILLLYSFATGDALG
jgi:hypothetical protein